MGHLAQMLTIDNNFLFPLAFNINISNPSNIFACACLIQASHVTKYPPDKIWEYPNRACRETYLKDNKQTSLHLMQIICSPNLTVFLELCSLKTFRFLEYIMSIDKYSSIFLHQTETVACNFLAISTDI